MSQGSADLSTAISPTIGRIEFGSTAPALPTWPQGLVTGPDGALHRAPPEPTERETLRAILAAINEQNRLLAAILARESTPQPNPRQDPRTYQTIDKPR